MMYNIAYLVYRLLDLYRWVLLIYCVLSFLPRLDNIFTRVIRAACDPVLEPVRSLFRRYGGRTVLMIDFSPIVIYFLIGILQSLVVRLMYL